MAELNLNQITDKLNQAFTGEERKLVFWYDEKAEFAEDVDHLPLRNAKVWHLTPGNQFETKYHLECVDTATNYLVYAPFAKPDLIHNHLADTLRYSTEFFAERISLLMSDLGIDERLRPVFQHYKKFFDNKARVNVFCSLEIETWNRSVIEQAMMSVLCRCKVPTYEEILRTMLIDGGLDENSYLAEFEKYDLLTPFWELAEKTFGFLDAKPTLEKLVMSMLVTYCSRVIHGELPVSWSGMMTGKSGSCMAFIDNLMNNLLYGDWYNNTAERIYRSLNAETLLPKLGAEAIVDCALFAGVDDLLIRYMTERLVVEDVGVSIHGKSIPEVCQTRRKTHFGQKRRAAYFVLEHACYIIGHANYTPCETLDELTRGYTESLYEMDRHYRYFWYSVDQLEDSGAFDELKTLVENIYTNDWLAKVCVNWNEVMTTYPDIRHQQEFYARKVAPIKDQLVVIISDAMRYEVGVSLLERLQADEKCKVTMSTMNSVRPSITKTGMAALLPHYEMSMTEDFHVLVDGKPTDSLEQRQAILQNRRANGRCVQFDSLTRMTQAELREVFTRQELVYVYHNQIDARGDAAKTENEVFTACEEAVQEIATMIRRLTTSANRAHFIVTADHGFLYKRQKLHESDKISSGLKQAEISHRYCMSDEPVLADGVGNITLKTGLGISDDRYVSYPLGADVFKAPGGMNYVHGGSSPQEMIIPVLDIKAEKAHKDVSNARIALVSLCTKVTCLILSLDFVQSEPVSDVVKETTYRLYFIDEDGNKISSEQKLAADKKEKETSKRMSKLRFNFKNKAYSNAKKYYLVAIDEQTDVELFRHEVMMDIAFAGNFGF